MQWAKQCREHLARRKRKKQVEGSEGEEFGVEKALELATYIGISISEFWDITPYELNIAAKKAMQSGKKRQQKKA